MMIELALFCGKTMFICSLNDEISVACYKDMFTNKQKDITSVISTHSHITPSFIKGLIFYYTTPLALLKLLEIGCQIKKIKKKRDIYTIPNNRQRFYLN